MSKQIGSTFSDELKAANLLGLPFSWGADGTFEFSDEITESQKKQILEVYAAHDFDASLVVDAAKSARKLRDELIAKSDWTQLSDSPSRDDVSWKEYRQALRDITKQPNFPITIEWPIKQ